MSLSTSITAQNGPSEMLSSAYLLGTTKRSISGRELYINVYYYIRIILYNQHLAGFVTGISVGSCCSWYWRWLISLNGRKWHQKWIITSGKKIPCWNQNSSSQSSISIRQVAHWNHGLFHVGRERFSWLEQWHVSSSVQALISSPAIPVV